MILGWKEIIAATLMGDEKVHGVSKQVEVGGGVRTFVTSQTAAAVLLLRANGQTRRSVDVKM